MGAAGSRRLGVIGAGMMGEALVRGLLASGWSADDVVMADVRAERLDELAATLGVATTDENARVVEEAKTLLLAVKPQDAGDVLRELGGAPSGGVLSIVAGMTTLAIEQAVGGQASVVRAMPNTCARVGKGVTALAPGSHVTEDTRATADAVFTGVGRVVWVDESLLDAVTAVSGSGPAYVFLVAEAMAEAGVTLGLPRDVAETLAFATVEGAGAMLTGSDEHPAVLRAQVTSPGGTTAAALSVLEGMAVRAAFVEAIRAAHRRSRELGG